ncbi:MAG TPA: PBP1A family penicillin-binding protein [Pyrinomonadaceae bacterium]|nr:PBP1A family penicillin-binding protein [Pyrinomonadaceae bacterium]
MGLKKTFRALNPAVKHWTKRKVKRLFRITATVIAVALISLTIFLIHSYRTYAKLVDDRLDQGYLTSRAGIYAAPRTLRPGQKYSPEHLVEVLRRVGYIESEAASEVWNGSFSVKAGGIDIRPNTNAEFISVVHVSFTSDDRISSVTGDDVALDSFTLAPESVTSSATTKDGAHDRLSFRDIPPVLVHAITSIEDRRFFDHHGLDIFGVARALIRNAGDERMAQGGSTITQQLVKNTYLTPERTLRRKYAEAMLAFTIERRVSKEDIFALYCNEIYLGQRGPLAVRGVDQAARVYFGKELKDLTLGEAATIAGMIQSPTRYSPVRQNDGARARRNTVLGTMVRDGFINLDQASAAASEPLAIAEFDPARESVAPYFIDYVNRTVERGTGVPPVDHAQDAHATVTTLDLDLQRLAADAIAHQLERLDKIYASRGQAPQVALIALDPKTGNILAMIGGRDYATSQLNRATDAERQPGSVFKPFVYAAALESGMSPLRMFKDAPQEFTYARSQKYRPSNYGGGFSMRDLPMRDGLIKSLNVVTVDVAMQTGLARVANTALKFGLPRPTPYPALALGTTEATPLQIASAYASFANGGRKIEPRMTATEDGSANNQVIEPTTAYMITDMLEGVIDHGTARAARGLIPGTAVAGKTGTSRDGWFVGYTPNLVCAVWIGFDDNKQLGLTGAEAALPAWIDFMKSAIDFRPELGGKSFAQPGGITVAEIDPETDELATGKCPMHERVAMLTTQLPASECFRHNIYFDFGIEQAPAQTAVFQTTQSQPSRKQQTEKSPGKLARLRDTQVETSRDGRRVLVNEMRIGNR